MAKASLTQNNVVSLVERLYGLDVSAQKMLNSYDDVNVHVSMKDQHSNKFIRHVAKDGYVLKVLNEEDSRKDAFVGAMHAAIKAVAAAGIPTSVPVSNLHGEEYSLQRLPNNNGSHSSFLVRLFQYVPGEMLEGKTLTPDLCFQVGQLAARLDKALKGFSHPGLVDHSRHWNLPEVVNMENKIDSIENPGDRQLVRDVVNQFKQNVLEQYDRLTTGVIHADLNEGNIIVKRTNDSTDVKSTFCVQGVLDFGDLVHGLLVYEVSITIAYMMIESTELDPLEAAGHTLAGYAKELTLSPADFNVLKECISARMAQSFTYGAHNHKLDPTNTYCLRTQRTGWPKLKQMWNMPKPELYGLWARILGQYGVEIDFGI